VTKIITLETNIAQFGLSDDSNIKNKKKTSIMAGRDNSMFKDLLPLSDNSKAQPKLEADEKKFCEVIIKTYN